MIYASLDTIADKLNFYLKSRFAVAEDKVLISNLVNQDGTPAISEADKVVITLVNIQEESIGSRRSGLDGMNRPINLNLYVLFSAYFIDGNYSEALKFLSAVISFFQANVVFNQVNTPDLPLNIEKLTFEIVNQDLQSQSHLWGTLGGKYIPSVIYKVRMITIQESNMDIDTPRISGVGSNNF